MKKLRLELDDLRVDTFRTGVVRMGARTVRGHAYTAIGYCQYPSTSCPPGETGSGYSCYCMYPNTSEQVCCSDPERGCSGGGMC